MEVSNLDSLLNIQVLKKLLKKPMKLVFSGQSPTTRTQLWDHLNVKNNDSHVNVSALCQNPNF